RLTLLRRAARRARRQPLPFEAFLPLGVALGVCLRREVGKGRLRLLCAFIRTLPVLDDLNARLARRGKTGPEGKRHNKDHRQQRNDTAHPVSPGTAAPLISPARSGSKVACCRSGDARAPPTG